jgi:hypothetical protein
MAKFTSDFALNIPDQFKTKIPLKPVKDVAVSELQVNPDNATYFKNESKEYFQRLEEDIRKRGILVPLIVKKDGTLLAGHNRLRVAKEIGLPVVPVQYVDESKYVLSKDAEREFIIKDNLLRRQFSSQEWIEVYRNLYPNFDERIQERTVGRPAKQGSTKNGYSGTISDEATKGKSKSSTSKKMVTQEPFSQTTRNEEQLTVQRIAKDTNQTASAVKKQLWKHKTQMNEAKASSSKKAQQNNTVKNKTASNDSNSKNLNAPLLKSIDKSIERIVNNFETTNEVTQKEVVKKLKALLKNLQGELRS